VSNAESSEGRARSSRSAQSGQRLLPDETRLLPDETRLDESAVLALMASLAGACVGGETSYESLKNGLRGAVARDPFDATVVTVLGGAFLFYVAEKGQNPKVTSYWDALVFISTCLSVGYADVFAKTPAGKAIAAAVMTFGPAMSGAILESPAGDGAARGETELLLVQKAIADKLDAILGELRAARV
jgi:voltage-gated potassium channel